MSKKTYYPIPVQKALKRLGKDIHDARLRRRITMALVAERAGVSRVTLAKIEKGDSGASIGAYASVLFVLGLIERLAQVADITHDAVGRELEEENLPKRVRSPRSDKGKADE